MAVGIIKTNWSGTSGGPGLTQVGIAETVSGGSGAFFTATNVQTSVNAMRTFWDSVKAFLSDDIVLNVSPTVDIYNEIDGQLIGSITAATAPTGVIGTGTGVYAMASGIKATLQTGVIRNGRRVRGGIYIVPAVATAMSTAGLVASTTRTSINTAGTTFMASLATPGLIQVVYSRPKTDAPTRPGALAAVSAYDTNEKAAILRGRRD